MKGGRRLQETAAAAAAELPRHHVNRQPIMTRRDQTEFTLKLEQEGKHLQAALAVDGATSKFEPLIICSFKGAQNNNRAAL